VSDLADWETLCGLLADAFRADSSRFFEANGGLSVSQLAALGLLDGHDDPVTVCQLAAQMKMSAPTASRAVQTLHQAGYAERIEAPGDRRQRELRITDAGRRALDEIWRQRMAGLPEQLAARLDDRQLRALTSALAPSA
jgi:DNA-binding MarR family transcriptional regulator